MFLPKNFMLGIGFSGALSFLFFCEISRDIAYYSISSLNCSDSSRASIRFSPYLRLSYVLFWAASVSIFITLSLANGSI